MKNVAIAITAVAGLAAGANGQAFEVVLTNTDGLNLAPGTLVEYSLYMDNGIGAGFTAFVGWASFAGRTLAPGTHNLPAELSTDGNTPDTGWEGRRPPSISAFPGGSGGGFRFSAQTYTAISNGLEGNGGLAYEGLAASAPLGGFNWDDSPRLEVFRGSFSADVEGFWEVEFVAVDGSYFNESTHSVTVIGAASLMESVTAEYNVIPAPGALALLGLGGLAIRRRR